MNTVYSHFRPNRDVIYTNINLSELHVREEHGMFMLIEPVCFNEPEHSLLSLTVYTV